MWVAGWLRRTEEPQETTNAESGTVTIGGSTAGVLSRGEERNVPLASPGGYAWRPKNGERVLVIKGGPGGEEQCVAGQRQAQHAHRNRGDGQHAVQLGGAAAGVFLIPAAQILAGNDRTAGSQRGQNLNNQNIQAVHERYAGDSGLTHTLSLIHI